jgi:hypothetical protein
MFSCRQLKPATSTYAGVIVAIAIASAVACSDGDAPVAPRHVLTTVEVSVGSSALEVGELRTATITTLDQDGAPIPAGTVKWSSANPEVAIVNPTAGIVFGIAPGTVTITATVDGKTGSRTVTVATAPRIRINEVQPKGDTPNGWIELFNPTAAAVDLAGWTFIDNNFFGPTYTFPAGSIIPPNGFFVVEEASLPFGIDGTDDAYLFSRFGTLVDIVFWPTQPNITYGRCPDGGTRFGDTTAPTKGTSNGCDAGALGAARSE